MEWHLQEVRPVLFRHRASAASVGLTTCLIRHYSRGRSQHIKDALRRSCGHMGSGGTRCRSRAAPSGTAKSTPCTWWQGHDENESPLCCAAVMCNTSRSYHVLICNQQRVDAPDIADILRSHRGRTTTATSTATKFTRRQGQCTGPAAARPPRCAAAGSASTTASLARCPRCHRATAPAWAAALPANASESSTVFQAHQRC